MWRTLQAAALLVCGCGGAIEGPGSSRGTEPSACVGAIKSLPVVLRSDLPGGRLLVGDDYLILLGTDGIVARIDRCSGARRDLASGIAAISSTLAADYVWLVRAGDGEQSGLFRVHVSGGAIEQVVANPRISSVRARSPTVYFMSGPSGDGASNSDWSVYALGADQSNEILLATLPASTAQYFVFQGVSEAGLYFSLEYDCFCTPPVRLLPNGASELVTLQGAERVGGRGAYSVAVAGQHLYVRAMGGEIARLPLQGGARHIVVPADTAGAGLVQFAANDRAVCWMAYGSGSGLEVAARCVDVSEPDRAVRELDRFEAGGGTSFGLAPDAAYWLRPIANSPLYELVAVAL
jgi:hypothetical protein